MTQPHDLYKYDLYKIHGTHTAVADETQALHMGKRFILAAQEIKVGLNQILDAISIDLTFAALRQQGMNADFMANRTNKAADGILDGISSVLRGLGVSVDLASGYHRFWDKMERRVQDMITPPQASEQVRLAPIGAAVHRHVPVDDQSAQRHLLVWLRLMELHLAISVPVPAATQHPVMPEARRSKITQAVLKT